VGWQQVRVVGQPPQRAGDQVAGKRAAHVGQRQQSGVCPHGQVRGSSHVEHLRVDRAPARLVVEAWQLERVGQEWSPFFDRMAEHLADP
jgi:hypothetical protein